MSDTASTEKKHSGLIPFQPGQSGNPKGRTKGARNKLGEAFIEALHESFKTDGADAIQRVITEKPDQYLKVIASLMPKEMNLNFNQMDDLTDDELIGTIRALTAAVQPYLAIEGTGESTDSVGVTDESEGGKRKSAIVH